MTTITSPTIAGLIVGVAFIILFSVMFGNTRVSKIKHTDAQPDISCMPSALSAAAITAFPVKEATALPQSYALEAVQADGGGATGVVLYYADHSLCPFHGSLTDQIQNGTVVVTVIRVGDIENGTDFQQKEMSFYTNDSDGTIAKVQAFDVGSHKVVGWEPFEGKDVVMASGKVIESTTMKRGGMVRFFDDNDKTIYSVTAMRSLKELQTIAASIS